MNSEQFGTSPAAYSKGDTIYVYRHDPQSTRSDGTGPATTLAAAATATTSNIQITANIDAFDRGDVCAIYSGGAIEIIQITADPVTTGGQYFLPTAAQGTVYTSSGRGQENTTAQAWVSGSTIVKLEYHSFYDVTPNADPLVSDFRRTTKITRDIPATQSARAADNTLKCRAPNTSDTRLEIPMEDADLIAPKIDYTQICRIGSEWFIVDSADGLNDLGFGYKMPKQVRNPNTTTGTITPLFGGGVTDIHDDVNVWGGCLRVWGSDKKTIAAVISSDDGHIGDGSISDPLTGTSGLTVFGQGVFYDNLTVNYKSCVGDGTCSTAPTFIVNAITGSVDAGQYLKLKGKVKEIGDETDKILHVDNLGGAGSGNTVGPKDFTIYQSGAIDSFGIEKYWNANGGRRYTYVTQDNVAGIGQQQDNPLKPNGNYLLNTTTGSNMVLYLPDDAQTGDMIRFVELAGNLTYNTSLILRAKKINSVATAIQGDKTGTKMPAGAGNPMGSAWDSGELIIQSRNASFGLVFVGTYDVLGSSESQQIPSNLRGWWLQEL